jgi:RHS repeat-associated protein
VRSATNDGGSLEDRYEYDAFGKPYKGDLTTGMNLGYTGKPYDSATGLYNYGYRDYKPETVRFTTVDPVRDGDNWFSFVNNDPVNWVDPLGLEITGRDVLTAVVNPVAGLIGWANSGKAAKEAANSGYEGEHNGKQDAFRHAYWNALNARDMGVEAARMVADAHEANPEQPDNERAMDMHNNKVGREIGAITPRLTDAEIIARVKEAVDNNTLKALDENDAKDKIASYEYGDYVNSIEKKSQTGKAK